MEIEIKIKDNKIFTCAAFILDQDELLNKIFEIRKYWGLDKKLISYDEFDVWHKQPHYDFSLTPEVAAYWVNAKNKLPDFSFTNAEPTTSLEIQQEIIDSNPMDLEIEFLLRKNGLSASFKKFILKAVVCGGINLNDWESIYDNEKFYHGDWLFSIPTYEKIYKGRLKEEIRRDRIWHWQKRKGETQLQIANDSPERGKIHPEDYVDTVKKGLKRYKLFLQVKGHV